MKCVCTVKGFKFDISLIQAGKTIINNSSTENENTSIINKSDFAPIGKFTLELGESTSEIELDKEEFNEANRLINEDMTHFRETCLVPFIKGLDKYAERSMTLLEQQIEINNKKTEKE